MTEPRIVTPQEAHEAYDGFQQLRREGVHLHEPETTINESYCYTVATEPDRTRAAVVQALRDHDARNTAAQIAESLSEWRLTCKTMGIPWSDADAAEFIADARKSRADAIENGADW